MRFACDCSLGLRAMLERNSHSVSARKVMCFITQWLSKMRRDRRAESCNHSASNSSQMRSASSSQRNTRRLERNTRSDCHSTQSHSPNTNLQTQPWETSRVPPPVIRTADGEYGYEHAQYELRRAQEHEQKFRETYGDGRPPNVKLTFNADGTQHYQIQTRMTRSTTNSNSRSDSGYVRGNPPPYSQYNAESSRETSREMIVSECRCGLRPTHLEACCPQSTNRRGSCPSYASHRSEPPSYDMVVSSDNAELGAAANFDDAERNYIPTNRQL